MLEDVAYCPRLLTTLVSLRQLRKKGYYWDNQEDPTTLRRRDKTIACVLQDRYGQFLIEYQESDIFQATFATFRKRQRKFTTWTKRAPLTGEAMRWHQRMGHPGPLALEHLIHASEGVRIRGPTTVECEACGLSKIKRQIRRLPREIKERPGERIALDFHDYTKSYDGFTSQMLLTCRISGIIWDYYLTDRSQQTLIAVLTSFLDMMKKDHQVDVKVIECDNEITKVKPQVGHALVAKSIRLEPSAPYAQAQNGGAERSGGVIKDKERAMRTGAKLPHQLWPEIGRTAVYLYNRTPSYRFKWRTPYDRFHSAMAKAHGIPDSSRKPNQTHLRVFGCKAYAMTPDALEKRGRLDRLKPKAWLGYLVGYRSSNIYRIWIPSEGKVRNFRDVIFNEDEVCNGDYQNFKDELLQADVAHIAKFIQQHSLPDDDDVAEPAAEEAVEVDLPITDMADDVGQDEGGQTSDGQGTWTEANSSGPYTTAKFVPFPSPPHSPPSALLAHAIRSTGTEDPAAPEEIPQVIPWQAAFLAGLVSAPNGKTNLLRLLRQGKKVHRNDLPAVPRWHRDLEDHPLGPLFLKAEEDHLQSHKEMRSWTEIKANDHRALGRQILDCMWVYVYKFDKHGRFQKCKARLVVRGDQQAKSQTQETYAATLAGRSFRSLIAIAARFDLEMIQYDVVNAFVHAPIDKDVFMRMPPGYGKKRTILILNKALYGLRISPLLWQKEFTRTLADLGYTQVPHEPCCYIKNGILVFFYVDDVIVAYRKRQTSEVEALSKQLQEKYKISGGDPAQWFLGMEIIRDRPQRRIWLSQTAYIDKIAKLADKKNLSHRVPMTIEELKPREDIATRQEIHRYQRKIGSILFAAVSTRPDVAFATSRLARFLANPSQQHHDAADRVLIYLQETRTLALRFGGADDLVTASDASFADNSIDRRSSQAFAMKLFGGLIGWRASKQDTVTTSTTEAELLSLAQAAKETLFVSRLLKELSVKLDDKSIKIECDNKQTINLVTAEIATLRTKLRHVDIHNHWLRQEVSTGRIRVEYTPSAEMMADGLTKALPVGKWRGFLDQLGLENKTGRLNENNSETERRLAKAEELMNLDDPVFQ